MKERDLLKMPVMTNPLQQAVFVVVLNVLDLL